MDCNKILKMLTKLALFVILLIFILSSFTAILLNRLNTGRDFDVDLREVHSKLVSDNDPISLDDQLKHTFWFLQITDLHISLHFDFNRAPDLEQFCTEYIDIIKPSVVLATGDLTDSRTKVPMGSDVIEKEWITYWNALNKTNVLNKTIWLDIRGNHDNFNVHNWNSHNNYFKKYSVMGSQNKSSYRYSVKHETEIYNFIAVDACLSPSPKRPFNFIGLLNEKDINQIKQMKVQSVQEKSNYTVWFGHYPTSSIAMPTPGLREIINGPYFCGHFHTVGGLVNHMYSTQPTGYLEIELSDWRDNRGIRLAVIDHGLFNFIDFSLNQWPVILITNPKNALYLQPNEPYYRMINSTHIRTLVFSKSKLTSVKFRIDGNDWMEMKHISGPLFVHKWQPNEYKSGLHSIQVMAIDTDYNERTVGHEFSLDGSKGEFTFGGRLMLRIGNNWIGYFIFCFAIASSIVPLILIKFLPNNSVKQLIENCETNTIRRFVFKLYLLTNFNKILIPLIIIPLYATFGPWLVGYLLDDHLGVVFVWGLFVDSSYLPGGINYMLGAIFILLFQIPITICLSHIIYSRYQQLMTLNGSGFVQIYCHLRHLFFVFFIICHILFSIIYYFAYGLMAYILGFLNTWSYIIYIILWHMSTRLTTQSFPEAIRPKYRKCKEFDDLKDQQMILTRPPIRRQ